MEGSVGGKSNLNATHASNRVPMKLRIWGQKVSSRDPDLSLAIFAIFVPRWTIGNAEESAPELRARIPIRYLESWKIVWILEICGEREI